MAVLMTYEELKVLWVARDERYACWKRPMQPAQILAVQESRIEEAKALTSGRTKALVEAMDWAPPVLKRVPQPW